MADLAERAYLEEVVALLWPTARVEMRGLRGAARARGSGRRLVVLPGGARPRLLVPTGRARAAAALRGYQTSATGRKRREISLAAAAARAGIVDLAPTQVHIHARGDVNGVEDHLSGVLGRAVYVSVHLGPPRAVRKPVLQILDAVSHRTIGFAKVGVDDLTRGLVAGEAATLTELARCRLDAVQVPACLHHGRWRGCELLVQSALVPDRSACLAAGLFRRAIKEVAGVRGVSTAAVDRHPYLARLRVELHECGDVAASAALGTALDTVIDQSAGTRLRFGSWHGDLTPWNLAAARQRVLVWDWEHFEPEVPLGFDLVHHQVRCAVRDGLTPAAALGAAHRGAPELLRGFQPTAEASRLAAFLYIAHIAARYVRDGEEDGATSLGSVSSWLPSVLDAVSYPVLSTS